MCGKMNMVKKLHWFTRRIHARVMERSVGYRDSQDLHPLTGSWKNDVQSSWSAKGRLNMNTIEGHLHLQDVTCPYMMNTRMSEP